jgi:hypothetical protein
MHPEQAIAAGARPATEKPMAIANTTSTASGEIAVCMISSIQTPPIFRKLGKARGAPP